MRIAEYAIAISICILVGMGCARPHPRPGPSRPEPTPLPPPPMEITEPEPVVIPTVEEIKPAPPTIDVPVENNEETGPVMAPPPIPFQSSNETEVVTEVTFTEHDAGVISATDSGSGLGLMWSVVDGTGCYSGMTVPSPDDVWLGNSFDFPIGIDVRAKLEVSGEFRVAESEDYHLVALWAPADMTVSRLCMYYSGTPVRGHYVIQTSWMKDVETTLKGKRSIPSFGDEKDMFHKMRMLLDRTKKEISYYVDDILVGTVTYEGEIPPISSVGMDVETSKGEKKLDIRYDNIRVRSFGPIY